MGHKKKIIGVIGICVALIAVSLVLALPEVFGLCAKGDAVCVRGFIYRFDNVIQTVFYFAFAIGIVVSIMYFLKESIFNIWKKFSLIFLPIAIILIIITPSVGGFMRPDKESITLWLAGLFFVVSIGIILGKRE